MPYFFGLLFSALLSLSPQANAAGIQSISVFGGAVAGYNVKTENVPWSPMLGVGFEYGTKRIAFYADIHSLPLFKNEFGPNSQFKSSFIMGTLGVTAGNKRLRVGPFFTGGYIGTSGGARLVITPKGGPKTGWHGMEYRIGYYAKNVVYGAALYTWRWTRFGPKKAR